MTAKMKKLGIMNGWRETPQEYVNHSRNCDKSNVEHQVLGNCYNEFHCRQCGIVYKVDSSG